MLLKHLVLKCAVLLMTTQVSATTTFGTFLSKVNFKHAELSGQSLEKQTVVQVEGKSHLKTFFVNQGVSYELELSQPVEKEDFNKKAKNSMNAISLSYKDKPTPYPGIITNLNKCSKKLIPVIKTINVKSKEIQSIKFFVGSKEEVGLCEESKITHQACTAFYFEEKSKVSFKLKILGSKNKDCYDSVKNFFSQLNEI